jgi:hypothetical protein
MKDRLEIKWPWEMIPMENVDEVIAQIKESIPPDHELQSHEIYPGIKWDGRPIFIVDDDTTGEQLVMNLEKVKRWKKTKFKIPTIEVFHDTQAIAELIERAHVAECAKFHADGTLK